MNTFLETKRLILKTTELSDLDNLIALRSDPDVMKYIGKNGAVQTKEEVEKFLTTAIEYQKKHGFGFCSVFGKATGAFIGQAGVFHLSFYDEQPEIEIAYRLHKKFWGKGYATELARALIRWGFQHLPNKRLVALIDPENARSRRVLEKAGMYYTGKVIHYNEEVPCYEIYKNDSIELVPYDTQWPEMAASEITKLQEILPAEHIIDIQHVGSTAIPGMSAKPILDIHIAVDSLSAIKQVAIDILKTQGYEYWYDNPDTERMFFVKGMPPFGEKRTHHVHIVESTSRHWQGKILFRDYLIAHSEAANEYESLKIKLAEEFANEREQYTEGKTQFVNRILEKAKLNK
jgi:GrpB-like predicted nucleotidyltransferase (UPF0157 family)